MLQKYSGLLGDFTYDDTKFKLIKNYFEYHVLKNTTSIKQGFLPSWYTVRDFHKHYQKHNLCNYHSYQSDIRTRICNSESIPLLFFIDKTPNKDFIQTDIEEVLMYIGTELDGSKINIPEGIKCCNAMFRFSSIKSVPKIPEGVLYSNYMFQYCDNLVEAEVDLPSTIISALGMFNGCTHLKEFNSKFPLELQETSYMFGDCYRLKFVTHILPSKLKTCHAMFRECRHLQLPPKILKNHKIKDMRLMFSGCTDLQYLYPAFIYHMYTDTTSMYENCTSLRIYANKSIKFKTLMAFWRRIGIKDALLTSDLIMPLSDLYTLENSFSIYTTLGV